MQRHVYELKNMEIGFSEMDFWEWARHGTPLRIRGIVAKKDDNDGSNPQDPQDPPNPILSRKKPISQPLQFLSEKWESTQFLVFFE